MAQAPVGPVPLAVQLKVGPFLFGALFEWMLLGILLFQLFIYSQREKKDPLWIKALVFVTVIIELVVSGLGTHAAYEVLVANWGIQESLAQIPRTFGIQPLTSALLACFVQGFLAWRFWVLGSQTLYRRIIIPLIVLLSLLQFGGAAYSVILQEIVVDRAKLAHDNIGFIIWASASMTADILIAASMLVILRSSKASTSFRETQTLLSRLIRLSVTSGLATATLVAIGLGLFVHKTSNFYFAVASYGIGKVYTNTLLANLNARRDTYINNIHDSGSLELNQMSRGAGSQHKQTHTEGSSLNVVNLSRTEVSTHRSEDDLKNFPSI